MKIPFLILFIVNYFYLNAQWSKVNVGLTDLHIQSLASDGTNIFAGTSSGEVFLSTDNGNSWALANTGILTLNPILALTISGDNIFAGTFNGVFLSNDNGGSWTSAGLSTTEVHSFAISGTNIFAGTYDGVYLSTDNGENWTSVSTGLTICPTFSLAMVGLNLFAGTPCGIYMSDDSGSSWNPVINGLTNSSVNSLAVYGSDIFAGTDTDFDDNNGMFISNDLGTNWTPISLFADENRSVYDFAISATDIFVGTGGDGVFMSTDNGITWTQVNTGLTNKSVASLTIADIYIFAGTFGGGVYRRALNDFTAIESANSNSTDLFLINPNPTASSFTIKLNEDIIIKNPSIEIYNVFGNLVFQSSTIISQNMIDLKGNSGLYFIKVSGDGIESTKKLIIE